VFGAGAGGRRHPGLAEKSAGRRQRREDGAPREDNAWKKQNHCAKF
jgi:hypothetical protein